MTYILNLELNFVENSDFRLGNYEMALKGFENAIRAKMIMPSPITMQRNAAKNLVIRKRRKDT